MGAMTLGDYQREALRTANAALDARARLMDAAAGLAEEAGEILGLIRKREYQDRPVPRDRLVEELGDVLWCLAVTADTLGISLDELARANLAKLQRRHPERFSGDAKL
jgi:NTP pyrophosphatase (non-canonical NTP hydrolase)